MSENTVANSAPPRTNEVEISLQIPSAGALFGLFASSIGYAFLLSTKEGRRWDRENNWFVVMIGVFLTLGWLAMTDPKAAAKGLVCFIVSGLPVMARAIILRNLSDDKTAERVIG